MVTCEIYREDLRPGRLCPLCDQPLERHTNRPRLLHAVLDSADAPPRRRRWMATNQRSNRGLGNVTLIDAVRFAFSNRRAGNGPTPIARWGR